MKKIILLSLVALLVLGVAASVYATGSTKISAGGPHNMPVRDTAIEADATGQPCAFCHTPHNAATSAGVPLRNKTVTGTNAFCMSCHDGTTDVSASIQRQPRLANLTGGKIVAGDADLPILVVGKHDIGGTTHPVGVDYEDAGGGVSETLWPLSDAVTKINALTGKRKDVVTADIDPVTCRGCHDVHNHATNTIPYLRGANNDSQLCVACHDL